MQLTKKMAGILAGVIIIGLIMVTTPLGAFAADASPKAVSGCPGFGQGGRMGGGPGMMQSFGPMGDALAKFMGIDAAKLRAERQAGKSLAQIAKENGKSEDELTNYMVSQHKDRLDQMVKEGRLTQEQAKAREGYVKERIKSHINGEGVGPGAGKCGRIGGGPGKGFRNQPPQQ